MKKKALMVWGGWDGHTPRESVEVFKPLLEEGGFEVELRDSLDAYLDRDLMESLGLIVQSWTAGTLSADQEKGLLETVRGGAGFAGWHGGVIDAFHDNVNYHFMTGGQWVAHPGDIVPSHRVEIADPEHPVTKGINGFEIRDSEQYYVHADPGNRVLCTTTFTGDFGDRSTYPAGVVMPYAWTRSWGKGRVFVACWGHTYRDFEILEAREIVRQGLLWAGNR